jgi:predicted TIM-barrel fold metal-dependent hydrolase
MRSSQHVCRPIWLALVNQGAPLIIDCHGHLNAPPELYAYQANLIASHGVHGKGRLVLSDDRLISVTENHIGLLARIGTDVQFLSPRPFTMMHSHEPPTIVQWFLEATNDVIARVVDSHPEAYRGVCGLPQTPGGSLAPVIAELERCVTELGFVGCLINPDPSEGRGGVPTLGEPYWYPLYEKMVELDVPAVVHSAGSADPRESYSAHFITEESIAVLSLLDSDVFERYPDLRLIICHGGGSIPYQVGRWRAARLRGGAKTETFDESLRRLYFDTVLYNRESLELLFRIAGTDRCLFGTEKPGSGTATDPATGADLDDLRPVIESIDWLTDSDRARIFEGNARTVFPRFDKSYP